ncbi:hypothetical protein, partial [Bifidobacterium sp.]|uniref:hypothetical protein n=2 Tax=unclassified Bifidobacterium TaxID=2608897 RepID=UPI0025BCF8E8
GKAGKEHHRAAKDRRKNLKTPHRKPTPGRVGTTTPHLQPTPQPAIHTSVEMEKRRSKQRKKGKQ